MVMVITVSESVDVTLIMEFTLISDVHGKGDITNGGHTMNGDGDYCFRGRWMLL